MGLAVTPTSENQNGYEPAELGSSTYQQVPELSTNHVKLNNSTLWQVQELGPGAGLVGELWMDTPPPNFSSTGDHQRNLEKYHFNV